MAEQQQRWFVVADDSRARVYEAEEHSLQSIHTLDHAAARAHVDELLTGDRGRTRAPQTRGSGGGLRAGMEPVTPPQEVEANKHVSELCDWLHKAATRHAFDELVIVAAPRTLGRLRKEISKPVKAKLTATLDKDWTPLALREQRELEERLHSAFPELAPDPSARPLPDWVQR